MKVKLDGRKMKDEKMVHKYLKEKFQLPDYYGNNLDALWDSLSETSDKLEIELYNEEIMYNNLGGFSEELLSLFEDLSIENENVLFKTIIDL